MKCILSMPVAPALAAAAALAISGQKPIPDAATAYRYYTKMASALRVHSAFRTIFTYSCNMNSSLSVDAPTLMTVSLGALLNILLVLFCTLTSCLLDLLQV